MYPLAVLRVFVGYQFIQSAMLKIQGDYLIQPRLAAEISEWLPHNPAPIWYKNLVSDHVFDNWQIFAYFITYCEFLIGLSFIFGFIVRPASLLALFLSINFILNSSPHVADLYKLYAAIIFILMWAGAGRCMGFDYFFFKRQRGIWW